MQGHISKVNIKDYGVEELRLQLAQIKRLFFLGWNNLLKSTIGDNERDKGGKEEEELRKKQKYEGR